MTATPQPSKGPSLWVLACLVVMGLLLIAALSFSIWRISLGKQVTTRLEQIRKAGEPANARELDAFYAKVPDEENAALVWRKGIEKLDPPYEPNVTPPWSKIELPARGGRLAEPDEANELVRSNEEALKLFRAAADMKRARYPVDLSAGTAALLPHLSELRSTGRLLRLEAQVAAENRRTAESARAVSIILRAAGSLKHEPLLISQLVRMGLNSMASSATEATLNLLTLREDELLKLQNAFQEAEDQESLSRAMLGERANGASVLGHPEEIKYISQSENPEEDRSINDGLKAMGSPAVRMTGFFQRDCRFFLDAMATNISASRLPDPERLKAKGDFEAMVLRGRKGYYIFSSLLLPSFSSAVLRDVEDRARVRVSQAAIAVERYRVANGKLPATLDELTPRFLKTVPTDPVNGRPIRFKLLPRGYLVYSIGNDGQDDGGKPQFDDKKRRAKSYDVTFTVERGQPRK